MAVSSNLCISAYIQLNQGPEANPGLHASQGQRRWKRGEYIRRRTASRQYQASILRSFRPWNESGYGSHHREMGLNAQLDRPRNPGRTASDCEKRAQSAGGDSPLSLRSAHSRHSAQSPPYGREGSVTGIGDRSAALNQREKSVKRSSAS